MLLINVGTNGNSLGSMEFSIPMNDGATSCTCPPMEPRASIGYLVLDQTTTFSSSNTNYEPPEEFGVEYQSANIRTGSTSQYQYFAIGDTTKGNIWIIQDSCECASLFTYPATLPELILGAERPPCVQLSPEFRQVGGHPTDTNCTNSFYYQAHPWAITNATLKPYVDQNTPCAASEVLVEGKQVGSIIEVNHFDLLLGFISQDTAISRSVAGDFHEMLNPGDRIEVKLVVKDQRNWPTTPVCGIGQPAPYPHYATPLADFTIAVKTAQLGAACGNQVDFDWVAIMPTPDPVTGNSIYTVEFNTVGDFYRKLRGLRVEAVFDDHIPGFANEGPEIVHIELQSATFFPAGGGGSGTPVNLGWSKAFRLVILDSRE